MTLMLTAIVGLIVGAVATLLMPRRDPGRIIVTMLLGIAGSLAARWLGLTLHWYRRADSAPGVLASMVGAVLLLVLYRTTFGRRRTL
jgi:uncharacterized membrane protein YeaQ/YmgE (transglycosylase-associated protein family)